jgi:RNA polymerase sigma factor (sigma-70 family)
MNFDRNARKNKNFLQTAIEFQNSDPSGDGDQNLQIELVYDCIAELDEFNKAIIILYLDGYSHEEISMITGISKTNVGTRIMRIKASLKKKVTGKLELDGIG